MPSKTTLLIIIGVLLAFILLTWHRSSAPMQDNTEQVETSEWVNDAGDLVASLKADPEYFAKVREEIRDSLAKVYNTKSKKVLEYVIATLKGSTNLKPQGEPFYLGHPPFNEIPLLDDSILIDTSSSFSVYQEFSSPYYKAEVQIGDSSYMHLQSFDTVTVLWKKVNEGSIFNRRHLIQLDVSTANPDTKVSGIKAYRIIEKPKKWGIGGQVGYGFSNSMKAFPYFGIGVSYNPIRF